MTNEQADSATAARQAIAAKVRGAVAEHKKSQREVAEILGLSQPVIQLRLKGKRPFRADELAKLAGALSVPVETFFPSTLDLGPVRPGLEAIGGAAQ